MGVGRGRANSPWTRVPGRESAGRGRRRARGSAAPPGREGGWRGRQLAHRQAWCRSAAPKSWVQSNYACLEHYPRPSRLTLNRPTMGHGNGAGVRPGRAQGSGGEALRVGLLETPKPASLAQHSAAGCWLRMRRGLTCAPGGMLLAHRTRRRARRLTSGVVETHPGRCCLPPPLISVLSALPRSVREPRPPTSRQWPEGLRRRGRQ